MRFIQVLTMSACTTLLALITSFVALPDNSGYFGLFLICVSPIGILAFLFWSYFLAYLSNRHSIFNTIFAYFILTSIACYSLILLTINTLNDGHDSSDFKTFLSDARDALIDVRILLCVVLTAALYSAIFNWLKNKRKPTNG